LDHFDGLRAVDGASAEGKNVGVVVFAGQFRGADMVGECRADAGNFVGRDGNTDTGATNGDAKFILAGGDTFADGFAVVGIVDGLFGPGAKVVDGVAGILQELSNGFFDRESGVIGAEGNAWLARSVGHARLVGGANGERGQPQLSGTEKSGARRNKENTSQTSWTRGYLGSRSEDVALISPLRTGIRRQFSGRDDGER
jgi:hypothetical protein